MTVRDEDHAKKGAAAATEDDPSVIERDIEKTRAEMSETLDAIQQKLNPNHLVDQALGYFQAGPAQIVSSLSEVAVKNPVPLALIGLGLGWIALSGLQTEGARAQSGKGKGRPAQRGTVARLTDQAKGAVSGAVAQAGDKAGQLYGSVKETATGLANQAYDQVDTSQISGLVDRASAPVRSFAESQPLLLGAVGLAVGAAIGASFSATSVENRLMGATRDDLVGRAREVGEDQLNRVQTAAENTLAAVRSEVSNSGLTPGQAAESLGDKLTRVAEAGYNKAKEELSKEG